MAQRGIGRLHLSRGLRGIPRFRQVQERFEDPGQPGREPRQPNPAEVGDGLASANHGQFPLVDVSEGPPRPARQFIPEKPAQEEALLDRDRGDAGQATLPSGVREGGGVPPFAVLRRESHVKRD